MRFKIIVVTIALALALTSCGDSDPDDSNEPGVSSSRTATEAPDTGDDTVTYSDAPDLSEPEDLAAALDQAHRAIIGQRASADEVRDAGEFVQLASRALGQAEDRQVQAVMDRLEYGPARFAMRQHVNASRQLNDLTEPQKSFPDDWEIREPRPAGELLGYYQRAQAKTGVPWNYLAAINLVETRMGRIHGTSTAGAQGPMQFIPPTWDAYGAGGDVEDPRDAILAAGRLLAANGGQDDIQGALWNYNQSDHYVESVSAYARVMEREPRAYRGYHAWQVLYSHRSGTYVMPVGYPDAEPELLPGE